MKLQTQAARWPVVSVVVALGVCVCTVLWQFFSSGRAGIDWPFTPWFIYASTLFGLTVVAITLARFRDDAALVQDLLGTLTQRVADKEQALQRNYVQLEWAARSQESQIERARILRDMHDSVGSHIGLAVRQIDANHTAAEVLSTLRTCLDRLKLSIDALQMPAGDVALLLANLRYRLVPRMASLGVAMQWEVAVLPTLDRLDVSGMRQLQYLIFEAMLALVAQSQGKSLCLRAWVTNGTVCVQISGDASDTRLQIQRAWQDRAVSFGANLRSWPLGMGIDMDIPIDSQPELSQQLD